ncbi:PspC domain-containing protein [bacterium]|nr:PspC domain-containing protein [bacterium]
MKTLKALIEKQAFGVCSYIGDRFGINSGRIRLYFIYTSFITLGSPVIIYLIMAFWLNLKDYVQEGHRSVWDL